MEFLLSMLGMILIRFISHVWNFLRKALICEIIIYNLCKLAKNPGMLVFLNKSFARQGGLSTIIALWWNNLSTYELSQQIIKALST